MRFRVRPTVLGGILLVFVAACVIWLNRNEWLWGEARMVRRALAEGRLDDASNAVARWLMSSPNSGEAHFLKAQIAWVQHDLSTVEAELLRAHSCGYTQPPLARLRGLLLARTNNSSDAEQLLRQTLETTHSPDPEAEEALVRLYLGSFQLGEAGAVLDQWIRGSPKDARPYLLQTEIDKRSQATPETIIAHYRAALDRDPTLDRARFGLAEELRSINRHAEAAVEYATYLSRQRSDPLGYAGAAHNALEMGEHNEAARLIEQALSFAPHDPEVLAAGAALELRRGQLDAALDYINQAVKADPFDHWKRYQRMLVLSRLGKKAEANVEREAVEKLKSDQARLSVIRIELLARPLDSRLRSEAAQWLMEHGHEDEAVEWANLVLRSEPAHSAMNRLLADFYRKKGSLGLANFHEAHVQQSSSNAVLGPCDISNARP
jgi:tetratricopeptide (TPR) repeat protein